jgi:hypothetical protein
MTKYTGSMHSCQWLLCWVGAYAVVVRLLLSSDHGIANRDAAAWDPHPDATWWDAAGLQRTTYQALHEQLRSAGGRDAVKIAPGNFSGLRGLSVSSTAAAATPPALRARISSTTCCPQATEPIARGSYALHVPLDLSVSFLNSAPTR